MIAKFAAPWARVAILVAGLSVASIFAYVTTGHLIPVTTSGALIYQNALLLLVLGSAIIEYKFTKPADSVVNCLSGLVTLLPVYGAAPRLAWFFVFGFISLVFIAAITCVALSDSPFRSGFRSRVTTITYEFATFFGQARILFSITLLFGVFSFYSLQSKQTVIFLCFWALYLSIWPLRLPELISSISWRRPGGMPIAGSMLRVEWPNIVRVNVSRGVSWSHNSPKMCSLPDGSSGIVLPLYTEQQPDQVVGTGIFVAHPTGLEQSMKPGLVYEGSTEIDASKAGHALGAKGDSPLMGFVVEDSEIGEIRFETWRQDLCKESHLVWVNVGTDRVYYQIVNGVNREEAFESNRHGFQVAIAAQVGMASSKRGFIKYPWLPSMNSPVFGLDRELGSNFFPSQATGLLLGHIPNTRIPIYLSLEKALDHHIAILGATGTGKTELALDIIRKAAASGTKVVCIDLTARYTESLSTMNPTSLSIDPKLAKELDEKLFAVETGARYGAEEKKVLREFHDQLRKDVYKKLKTFIEDKSDAGRVGIVMLPEISNTKAMLHITELYLSLVLGIAKNFQKVPRILLVLEEAHTIIPEATTMGVGDYDSKGLVGKMAQIALQGRKYRVGLLVISQRTATVSKTVLTQCNTIISFSCIDDTSLGFLKNVIGPAHTALIPNLLPLQAVAFGKGIRSERPLVVEVPFDERKLEKDEPAINQDSKVLGGARPASENTIAAVSAETIPDAAIAEGANDVSASIDDSSSFEAALVDSSTQPEVKSSDEGGERPNPHNGQA